MKFNFDKHRDVWGPVFTLQLQTWADRVLAPAAVLIENGQMDLQQCGEPPIELITKGSGKQFSAKSIRLHLLDTLPANYDRVKYFDYAAAEYEMATHGFKKYIVNRAFSEMFPYISNDFRIMDAGCGPGYEAIALSMRVPEGEVVAVDLSTEMIKLACKNAKYHRVSNMCFYQVDVQALPRTLNEKFDVIYCQLNCSYFEDVQAVAASFYNALREKGMVFLVEPYPNTPNSLSINTARAANPYFERLYEKEELEGFFREAGFSNFFWKEILPGFGISMITKNKTYV